MTANHTRKTIFLQTVPIFLGLFVMSALVAGTLKYYFVSRHQQLNSTKTFVHQQKQVHNLLQLMQQRLMIAHDVARWKWNKKLPIEDRQREQELITKVRQQARVYNIQTDTVTAFFQGQIEAGKQIQKADFQTWQKQGIKFFTNIPDLKKNIRPSLDKLNEEFFPVLAEVIPSLGCSSVRESIQSRAPIILKGDGIDRKVQRTALAPLLEIKEGSCPKTSP
ncbi:gamma subclass chorismate mutase AroQ [Scytonema sp. UIC 10036]|uniref:gamma subclass chorismate mutase AroQ n=1 Tax=Scytonema sp. UIC 10036 TaxID=2304196 RepID=UPI0012DAD91D|nr:gamma subclass chorismate mutase AroQ [Scytonema sp. UIC 10036]MUG95872.1 gamma subclass chorismate mutase AroQ [Scytonema sp. UIC 10036]